MLGQMKYGLTQPAAQHFIARGKRIAYPYVFERTPGVLWVTSMQGDRRATLEEADFTKDK